jgi:hypothetical protein
MSRYTFIKHSTEVPFRDPVSIEFNTEQDTWPELIEDFKQFLAGCGFTIPPEEE